MSAPTQAHEWLAGPFGHGYRAEGGGGILAAPFNTRRQAYDEDEAMCVQSEWEDIEAREKALTWWHCGHTAEAAAALDKWETSRHAAAKQAWTAAVDDSEPRMPAALLYRGSYAAHVYPRSVTQTTTASDRKAASLAHAREIAARLNAYDVALAALQRIEADGGDKAFPLRAIAREAISKVPA